MKELNSVIGLAMAVKCMVNRMDCNSVVGWKQ